MAFADIDGMPDDATLLAVELRLLEVEVEAGSIGVVEDVLVDVVVSVDTVDEVLVPDAVLGIEIVAFALLTGTPDETGGGPPFGGAPPAQYPFQRASKPKAGYSIPTTAER